MIKVSNATEALMNCTSTEEFELNIKGRVGELCAQARRKQLSFSEARPLNTGSFMYCPKCGQQQLSETMRFCSRCGLPLVGMAEWIAGGAAIAARENAPEATEPSARRKGVRRGAKLMFISGPLFAIFFGLSILVDNPVPLMVPLAVFLTGLTLMLYTRLFIEETAPAKREQHQPTALGTQPERNALPPATPFQMDYAGKQGMKTAGLRQPPSVTEHTTKLLDNEEL